MNYFYICAEKRFAGGEIWHMFIKTHACKAKVGTKHTVSSCFYAIKRMRYAMQVYLVLAVSLKLTEIIATNSKNR